MKKHYPLIILASTPAFNLNFFDVNFFDNIDITEKAIIPKEKTRNTKAAQFKRNSKTKKNIRKRAKK